MKLLKLLLRMNHLLIMSTAEIIYKAVIVSGNIISQISDYLPQFVILNNKGTYYSKYSFKYSSKTVSLSILINQSFESGIFPDKLKIIPIFKKDDSTLFLL